MKCYPSFKSIEFIYVYMLTVGTIVVTYSDSRQVRANGRGGKRETPILEYYQECGADVIPRAFTVLSMCVHLPSNFGNILTPRGSIWIHTCDQVRYYDYSEKDREREKKRQTDRQTKRKRAKMIRVQRLCVAEENMQPCHGSFKVLSELQ